MTVWNVISRSILILFVTSIHQFHIDGFTTYRLSICNKLVTFIKIALHCNDSYFHSEWRIFQSWPNWLKKVNLHSFQSKWSGLKKMVILSENSCHCNAIQCNAILMKVTCLVRINPCLSMWIYCHQSTNIF